MLLKYCLSDSEMVPVAHFITGITFAVKGYFKVRYFPTMTLYLQNGYFKVRYFPTMTLYMQ